MTVVFADTSFFVAFLSSTDQQHAAANDYSFRGSSLGTPFHEAPASLARVPLASGQCLENSGPFSGA